MLIKIIVFDQAYVASLQCENDDLLNMLYFRFLYVVLLKLTHCYVTVLQRCNTVSSCKWHEIS